MENFEMEWNSFGISLDGILVKLNEVWVRFWVGFGRISDKFGRVMENLEMKWNGLA